MQCWWGIACWEAIDALADYEEQKKEGKNPVFRGSNIGLNEQELEYWNE